MKKLLIVILIAIGAVQAASIITPKAKPSTKEDYATEIELKKEILPEVIIDGTLSGQRVYTTVYTLEINPFCPKDNPNYKAERERAYLQENAEGAVVFVKHCPKCNAGVFSQHNEESFKRCTFCGEKESSN